MRSQICLIRHGKTVGNVRRLYYGKTDVPLAQEGMDELKAQNEKGIYPKSDYCQIMTTGLIRTVQTKDIIYGEHPYGVIEDLQEINFGEFEMKSYEQLLENADYRDWITAEDLDKVPPGGESIRQFNHRVIRGYETLREAHREFRLQRSGEDEDAAGGESSAGTEGNTASASENFLQVSDAPLTVMICHGGTISAIMDHIYPGVHDNMYGWIPDPGHGYLLALKEEEIADCEEF